MRLSPENIVVVCTTEVAIHKIIMPLKYGNKLVLSRRFAALGDHRGRRRHTGKPVSTPPSDMPILALNKCSWLSLAGGNATPFSGFSCFLVLLAYLLAGIPRNGNALRFAPGISLRLCSLNAPH
jgi:hypothetical protein